MAITWPSILAPQRASVNLRAPWASGGQNVFGREQRVTTDAGFWEVDLRGIRLANRDQHYAFQEVVARLQLGEPVNVPLFGQYPLLHSLDTDDSSLALSDAAALRATTLVVSSQGVEVRAGARIGIGNRLHTIVEVTSAPATTPWQNQLANDSPWVDAVPLVDDVDATGEYTITINPPLRQAWAAASPIKAKNPTVQCWLSDPRDGSIEIGSGRLATPSLSLVEYI